MQRHWPFLPGALSAGPTTCMVSMDSDRMVHATFPVPVDWSNDNTLPVRHESLTCDSGIYTTDFGHWFFAG